MSTLFVFFMVDKCALEFECQDYIDRTLTSIIFIDSSLLFAQCLQLLVEGLSEVH
jgi:hypothetical protein